MPTVSEISEVLDETLVAFAKCETEISNYHRLVNAYFDLSRYAAHDNDCMDGNSMQCECGLMDVRYAIRMAYANLLAD